MSGSMRSFATITRLIQKQPLTDPINRIHPFLRNQTQTQTREYFRFPKGLRKVREYEISPYRFTSSFCSSSSSSTASFRKLSFVGWYLRMVKSWPILTKSVTSAAIYIAADLSSQVIIRLVSFHICFAHGDFGDYLRKIVPNIMDYILYGTYIWTIVCTFTLSSALTISMSSSDNSEPYDLVRTLRMAGYGLLILGPSLHFWFNFVSKLFPKRDLISTVKKMAMGQLIYGPAMTIVFFSLNARLQGESNDEIVSRLKRDLLPTMLNGVMYWPFCDFITFRFIPVHLQPLVSNSFSYLWTIYMTYMASLQKPASITC